MIDLHYLRSRLERGAEVTRDLLTTARDSVYLPLWRRQALEKRREFIRTYIVIVGSCGKSTATMLSSALLSAQRPTGTGNYQNNVRLVLRFVRKWDRKVDLFVQELSEYPVGTITDITETLRPEGALVTAIGLDHRAEFRTLEAIVAEMAPLVRGLSPDGFLCLNADDPNARAMAELYSGRVVLFGRSPRTDLRVEDLKSSPEGRLNFDLIVGTTRRNVQTRFVGTLLLPSIVGALAIVHALGLDLDQAIRDLATIEPVENRMAPFSGDDGHTYLIDSFKAPLWSTQLMVQDIPNMSTGRRVLVLGEVSDIANDSSRYYRQLLRRAAEHCDLVIGIEKAASAAERLKRNEPHLRVIAASGPEEVQKILRAEPPSLVIVKGNKLKRWIETYQAGIRMSRPRSPQLSVGNDQV
ncbi:MAG: Mur ligase family protein [Devosia sp.]